MDRCELTELIPGLTPDLGLDCLTRLHYTAHRAAAGVCRLWRDILKSSEFYHHRKKNGYTRKLACLVQASPLPVLTEGEKPGGSSLSYSITVFDPVRLSWERVNPIPKYPNGLPLFCQLTSFEGKLIVLGGWDPVYYDQVTGVFVYDFTTCEWRTGKDMPSRRSFFAIGCVEGRVFVAGGHDESKNALSSAWVYELDRDEWTQLSPMSQERDECEGIVVGNEFWVVSGYRTESQGAFEESADVYNMDTGHWKRMNQVWESGQCPRSSIGTGPNGRIVNLGRSGTAIQVATCGVVLGNMVLLIGSEYQGGPHGIYMAEMKEGQKCKLERVEWPESDGFCCFVQSGCCMEI